MADLGRAARWYAARMGWHVFRTTLETLRSVLGDYAAHCQTDTQMQTGRARGADNDLARLRGARFVTAIESGEARHLDEERIKALTGGDTITARFLYREHFEFRPAFKLWVAVNHKPEVRGTDHAIWRRLRLIPFTVTIPEERLDPDLAAKLRTEAPGILAWAVRGCLEWQRDGMRPPEAVLAATRDWRAEAKTGSTPMSWRRASGRNCTPTESCGREEGDSHAGQPLPCGPMPKKPSAKVASLSSPLRPMVAGAIVGITVGSIAGFIAGSLWSPPMEATFGLGATAAALLVAAVWFANQLLEGWRLEHAVRLEDVTNHAVSEALMQRDNEDTAKNHAAQAAARATWNAESAAARIRIGVESARVTRDGGSVRLFVLSAVPEPHTVRLTDGEIALLPGDASEQDELDAGKFAHSAMVFDGVDPTRFVDDRFGIPADRAFAWPKPGGVRGGFVRVRVRGALRVEVNGEVASRPFDEKTVVDTRPRRRA